SLVPPMERSTAKIPGFGDINWGRWVGALADAGYDGPVCVEVEDEAFEGSLERRLKSLRISYRVLRPLIA
ncbi:MAG TPA: sugar phosphate isomerase/epimerase, partial [Lacipirellulaceae bacterium]|nr:sugar phosphate isomerase/epimerase [Lacipirellulaceae bacterium]